MTPLLLQLLLALALTQTAKADSYIYGKSERSSFIQEGKVWEQPQYEIGSQSLSGITTQCQKFSPDEVVTCSYLKPKRGKISSGWTPKFYCLSENGEKLKVKYGQNNGEVFSEVFSSRLVQLIGFKADCNYPVRKVICTDCPENPFEYSKQYSQFNESPDEAFSLREYPYVLIEKKFGEEIIAEIDDQEVEGWGFDEFLTPALVHQDSEQNLAREALTLLMSVLEHGDNKRSNQRLYCKSDLDRNGKCPTTEKYLVVQDLGATLGTYKFKDEKGKLINLPPKTSFNFYQSAPIWNLWTDARWSRCTAQVLAVDGETEAATLKQQQISEAGRKFLENLLSQVSYKQIQELVAVSKLADRTADKKIDSKLTGLISNQLNLYYLPTIPFKNNQVSSKEWADVIWMKMKIVEQSKCQ